VSYVRRPFADGVAAGTTGAEPPDDRMTSGVSTRLVDRRREVVAARHRRRRTMLLGCVATAAAASGAWWIATGPVMTVSNIAITGYDLPDQAKVIRAVQIASVGADALHVPTAEVERALAGMPWVADVSVSRDLPRGLNVRITKADSGAVAVTDDGRRFIVSRTGRVLQAESGASTTAQLPEIRLPKVRVGQWLPAGAGRVALSVAVSVSPDVSARVRDLRVENGVLSGRLSDGPQVRFGQPINLRQKARALDAILASPVAQADLADAEYIDLSAPDRPIMGGVERADEASSTGEGSESSEENTQP